MGGAGVEPATSRDAFDLIAGGLTSGNARSRPFPALSTRLGRAIARCVLRLQSLRCSLRNPGIEPSRSPENTVRMAGSRIPSHPFAKALGYE